MARFLSTITDKGVEVLTQMISSGTQLQLTRAVVGDGRPNVSPNTLQAIVSPVSVKSAIGEMVFIQGTPSITKIPVQVTNEFLEETVYVREIGIMGIDTTGQEFLFAYSWLESEVDTDNVLPASAGFDFADTVHLHDIGIVMTTQQASAISVQIAPGSYVTFTQMESYAAPAIHIQQAATVMESTGENTEGAQRRQDYDIQAIKEQLDTGFVGTTVVHNFEPAQREFWLGYDGTGVPEGVLNNTTNRITA